MRNSTTPVHPKKTSVHPRGSSLPLALLLATLAGCSVGPDYVRPEAPLPEAFVNADAGTSDAATTHDAVFWKGFDDALLSRLIEQTIAQNFDLAAALARYDRANALLRGQRLDRFPTVRAQAGAGDARTSAADAPGVARDARDGERYDAAIVASWELDLFGRVRRSVEARAADVSASAADVQALQVALVGEVARTYIELRGAQQRLQVARENADNQQETLRLVEARLDAGSGTDFDRARARGQLEATRARIPALEAQVANGMHRLAVLVGREPGGLNDELAASRALPRLPAKLDAGTPGELVRRRPDVAAAERRLHAATARIGVATADLFPRFSLGALLGSSALESSALFERDSESRSVALGIDWSFLDTGRVRAGIAAAEADADGALAQYRQSVLLALEDVENALVNHGRARIEDAHLARAAEDGAEAARLARVRFEAGAIGLLEVLDAERARLQAQDQLAEARTRTVSSAVRLYVALAGGWIAPV
jgi:outer membrane protein, multidrug efflux system